jgi:peptide/nickel transport system permease protein
MPLLSIFIIIFLFIFSFYGNTFYGISPYILDSLNILTPPSYEHIFGTDRLGRDLLARVIEGSRVSLIIGFGSAFVSSIVALIYGSMAGYFRGYFDKVFVLLVDLFLTFPTLFLLLGIVGYVKASTFILILIISLTSWMGMARLIRSESFKITQQPYIKILKIARVNRFKILLKYYAPILAPIYLVGFTFSVGGAILTESSLSFLGLGIVAPQMSLGTILSSGKDVVEIAWWISFFPGFIIFLIIFSLINISNYLQHLINPNYAIKN